MFLTVGNRLIDKSFWDVELMVVYTGELLVDTKEHSKKKTPLLLKNELEWGGKGKNKKREKHLKVKI